MKKATDSYFSKTIDKGLRILSLFNQDQKSISLKKITQELCINKTSAFRFVDTFVQLGYLKKDSRTKLLHLGPKAISLSYNLIKSYDLLHIIEPVIEKAHCSYNLTIHVALLDNDLMLIICQREAKETLVFRLATLITALHTTALGKAALAYLPVDEMRAMVDRLSLVKMTNNSISRKSDLIADLKKTKKRGYSLNLEEHVIGLYSIGAPLLRMEDKRPIGAIAFDFPTAQYSLEVIEEKFSKVIKCAAKEISKLIP